MSTEEPNPIFYPPQHFHFSITGDEPRLLLNDKPVSHENPLPPNTQFTWSGMFDVPQTSHPFTSTPKNLFKVEVKDLVLPWWFHPASKMTIIGSSFIFAFLSCKVVTTEIILPMWHCLSPYFF